MQSVSSVLLTCESPIFLRVHFAFSFSLVSLICLVFQREESSICHTARLPAEIRYKGILTQSTTKIGASSYDKGTKRKDDGVSGAGDLMRLVHDDEDPRDACNETLYADFKDYFYVSSSDGWKELVLPNDAEVKEYGTTTTTAATAGSASSLRGVIAVCFVVCDWQRCETGNVLFNNFNESKAEMRVNGEPVVGFFEIDENCQLLKGPEGLYWKANDEGRYNIRARTMGDNTFMRFSSFIIW